MLKMMIQLIYYINVLIIISRNLEYFKKTNLLTYDIKDWNYYENIKYITNNECESYSSFINDFFNKKPTFYK